MYTTYTLTFNNSVFCKVDSHENLRFTIDMTTDRSQLPTQEQVTGKWWCVCVCGAGRRPASGRPPAGLRPAFGWPLAGLRPARGPWRGPLPYFAQRCLPRGSPPHVMADPDSIIYQGGGMPQNHCFNFLTF